MTSEMGRSARRVSTALARVAGESMQDARSHSECCALTSADANSGHGTGSPRYSNSSETAGLQDSGREEALSSSRRAVAILAHLASLSASRIKSSVPQAAELPF